MWPNVSNQEALVHSKHKQKHTIEAAAAPAAAAAVVSLQVLDQVEHSGRAAVRGV